MASFVFLPYSQLRIKAEALRPGSKRERQEARLEKGGGGRTWKSPVTCRKAENTPFFSWKIFFSLSMVLLKQDNLKGGI